MKNTTKTPPSKKFKKAPPPKAQTKEKSPSNSRIIPEKKPWYSLIINKYFFVSFITVFLGVAISLQGLTVIKSLDTLKNIKGERIKIEGEIIYWEKIISSRANYRDAYFKLALLTYQLGEKGKAKYYLDKTLEIDPNYQPAIEFRKEAKFPYSP